MAASHLADQIGRVLGGRYRLVAPIGTGASAAVFAADDVSLRRRVAVKVLHPALAEDGAFLRRFRAEAQAVAALEHPNIVSVYDWGEDGGTPFLVLQLLSGGSLRNMLDAGHRLSPSQALMVGLETARALDYAHRRGLVHRDIKPANLLFHDDGRVCVADFGIARALAEAAWTEPAGAVLGTARYASPEQVQGAGVDGRTDVYALALVLIEAVTGQVPFAADTTIATLMGRLNGPLTAPEAMGALAPAIEAAGRAEPAQRSDAATFAHALDRAARSMPEPARLPLTGNIEIRELADDDPIDLTVLPNDRPAGAFHQASRPRLDDAAAAGPGSADVLRKARHRRRRRWPWVVLLAVVLLAGGGAGAYAFNRDTRPSEQVPIVLNVSLDQARQMANAAQLQIRVASETFHETAPAGTILSQNPPAPATLKKGASIAVIVSKGAAPRPVPDLTNVDQATSDKRLTDAGFTPQDTPQSSDTIKQGTVIGWQPQGTQPKGTPINVVISSGPAPVALSNWAGHTYDDFSSRLTPLNIKVARRDAYSDTVPAGQIISTDPAPGAMVARDGSATVTATVSKGFQPLPDVSGKSVDDATNTLTAAGYQVTGVDGPPNKPVAGTNPAAGTPAKKGTQVRLITKG